MCFMSYEQLLNTGKSSHAGQKKQYIFLKLVLTVVWQTLRTKVSKTSSPGIEFSN